MTLKEQKKKFNEWLVQHKGIIFKVVRAYGDNELDQQELFQEISLQLWESVPGYRRKASEATWIYKVSLYTALAWLKKERKHQQNIQEFSSLPPQLTRTEEYYDDQLAWIYQQINQLEELDRSLMLMWLDGIGYRDMSDVLGISESHVGVKINRIKKYLAEKIKNQKHEI